MIILSVANLSICDFLSPLEVQRNVAQEVKTWHFNEHLLSIKQHTTRQQDLWSVEKHINSQMIEKYLYGKCNGTNNCCWATHQPHTQSMTWAKQLKSGCG